LNERRTFWNVLYKHVVEKGPLIPIKILKHSSQTLYSKTKGGVDGLTQFRNILNTPSSSLPWEQKMVIQCLKNLMISSFISYRFTTCRHLVQSSDAFKSLHFFQSGLNHLESLSTFIYYSSSELLTVAQSFDLGTAIPPITADRVETDDSCRADAGRSEKRRLRSVAKRVEKESKGIRASTKMAKYSKERTDEERDLKRLRFLHCIRGL